MTRPNPRVLVAGVGNVFCGDDGFGVAVAEHLAAARLPAGVELAEFGIRGVHLAYQLLDGYDLLVLVDTVQRRGSPGTVYLIEHGGTPDHGPAEATAGAAMDAHDMTPDAILALVPRLGGSVGQVVIVGCEPASIDARMGLSPEVERSVEAAATLVLETVAKAVAAGDRANSGRVEVGRDA